MGPKRKRVDMRAKALAAVLVAGLAAAGCTRMEKSHGFAPTENELALVEVGRDTRATVEILIGAPTFESLRTVDGWYYVKSDYETYLWRAPEEVNREVVAILFSQAGTVANIERFGLENGRVIPLSRRVTESNVSGISFTRQLFGNVGNFQVQDFFDGENN